MIGVDDRLTLVEHLTELRKRLFVSAASLVLGIIIAGVFNSFVFHLLLRPLPAKANRITTFSPSEPFLVSLKVWAYAGIILASPILLYEFWAFVAPAFSSTTRRKTIGVVALCAGLFLGGVVFGYYFVLPRGLSFLLGWNSDYFNVQNRATDYFTFVAWFLVAFGAVFEMPVILVSAIRLGVIDVKFLRHNRKYAVLINAAIAAVATPSQDVFSMLAMLVPLLFLYEASIVVGHLMTRKRTKGGRSHKLKSASAETDAPEETVLALTEGADDEAQREDDPDDASPA